MTVTATAKRRRREAKMVNGRKMNKLDFKRRLVAMAREKKRG